MKKITTSLLMIACASAASPSSGDDQSRPQTSQRSSGISPTSDLHDQEARLLKRMKKVREATDRAADRVQVNADETATSTTAAAPTKRRPSVSFDDALTSSSQSPTSQDEEYAARSVLKKSSKYATPAAAPTVALSRFPNARGARAIESGAIPEKSYTEIQQDRQDRLTNAARARIEAIEAAEKRYNAAIRDANRP